MQVCMTVIKCQAKWLLNSLRNRFRSILIRSYSKGRSSNGVRVPRLVIQPGCQQYIKYGVKAHHKVSNTGVETRTNRISYEPENKTAACGKQTAVMDDYRHTIIIHEHRTKLQNRRTRMSKHETRHHTSTLSVLAAS